MKKYDELQLSTIGFLNFSDNNTAKSIIRDLLKEIYLRDVALNNVMTPAEIIIEREHIEYNFGPGDA